MNIYLAEFLGTLLLITLGCGVNAGVSLTQSYARNAGWFVVCSGWGLGVIFAIYLVGKQSGGHLNPAVTLALASIGDFEWAKVPGYLLAQLLGAMAGAILVYLHYLPHWKLTQDPATKLGVFATSPAIKNTFSNFFSEFLGTFVLLLGLLALGSNEFSQGLNPIVVGFLIVAIGLSLGGTTGWAINPARDLGPRMAHFLLPIHGKGGSDWSYAWIPVLAPVLGGIAAAWVYKTIF
jgi:glycerol uptake facilitator protein